MLVNPVVLRCNILSFVTEVCFIILFSSSLAGWLVGCGKYSGAAELWEGFSAVLPAT